MAGIVVLVFLALPVFAIIERALEEGSFFDVISSSDATEALRISLITTSISLVLTVAFGTPVAYLLARGRFPGHGLLDTLVDLPIVLPPAVGGLGLLMAFGRRGIAGEWLSDQGIEIAFTTTAVVLAQTFVSSPFYIRAAKAGFEAVDREMELVAYTLGSSRTEALRRIAIPMAMPALMAGAVMAWARALGEFGATILFAGNFPGRTQTMPLLVYGALERDLGATYNSALILLGLAALALVATRLLLRVEDGEPDPLSGG